jgi:hypothetical protein
MDGTFSQAMIGEYCEYGTQPNIPQHRADWVFAIDMCAYNLCNEHIGEWFTATSKMITQLEKLQSA